MLLLQPKTEDSHRLKIHVLDNDVDKNVLKTSDASCLCEAGLTSMINDSPMTAISYKNTKKIFVFSCDRPGDKARAKGKKIRKYHHFIFHAISQKPFCIATPFSPGPAKHTL